MRVRYETWHGDKVRPPLQYAQAVQQISSQGGVKAVCDIGGGANPLLTLKDVERAGVERYAILDVSEEELAKAPEGYEKVVADITRNEVKELGSFDLIVSHAVAEHITNPAAFHRAIFGLLAPGGRAMHYFPTFYDPVFVVNRLLPETIANGILQRIQTDRVKGGSHEKFPAYYRWCRGPTRHQIRRLDALGFVVEEYVGVFGHGYFHPVPALNRFATSVADLLVRHPVASLTTYAWMVLSRSS